MTLSRTIRYFSTCNEDFPTEKEKKISSVATLEHGQNTGGQEEGPSDDTQIEERPLTVDVGGGSQTVFTCGETSSGSITNSIQYIIFSQLHKYVLIAQEGDWNFSEGWQRKNVLQITGAL